MFATPRCSYYIVFTRFFTLSPGSWMQKSETQGHLVEGAILTDFTTWKEAMEENCPDKYNCIRLCLGKK